MKSAEILSKTDRTSWSRIAMAARYFMPRLRWMLWVYPLTALLLSALTFLLMTETSVEMGPMNLMSLLVALGPLALGRRTDGELTFSLPALGLEKCIFLFGFFLIVIPALTYGIAYLSELFMLYGDKEPGLPQTIVLLGKSPQFIALSALQLLLMITVCLWVMMGARSSRVLLATVATFGVSVANSLAIGIMGAIIGFRAALNGTEPDDFDMAGVTINSLLDYATYAVPVMAVLLIAAIILAGRTISRRQI